MRLLHTTDSRFEIFTGRKPEYAILSHRWGEAEGSYQKLLDIHERANTCTKPDSCQPELLPWQQESGIQKIFAFCQKARKNGFEWAWVDTCCIDKSSSAELSEAINSMFRWYAEASVCYAYLVDFEAIMQPDWTTEAEFKLAFEHSKWWTRGWCLQELIAPRNIEFLASDWSDLGTKFSLRQLISDITGIRLQILMGASLAVCCAAEKMSWASTRETTRPEDVAYCLLGLFGVNMPLLYGEGATKAFIRLQKEILAQEPDYSLLAWSGPCTTWRVSVSPAPALAVRPQQFHREMQLEIVDLEQSREGNHTIPENGQQLPMSVLRWEDVVFNPRPRHDQTHPKWLKDAIAANSESGTFPSGFHSINEPTNVTNRGLHARLSIARIASNVEGLVDFLAWTYIIHPEGLVCVCLGKPDPFSGAIYARSEAIGPILVPFKYLTSAFTLTWIYLRLPSPSELQDGDSRDYRPLRRNVLLIDDTVPRPSLFIAAQYPDPIRHWDSPSIRTDFSADLNDLRLIGCCLVNCEPCCSRFIVMIGMHPTINQILLKAAPWQDWSSSTTESASKEIAADLFKRWEMKISTLVEGFSDQASFSPANGKGVVKLRVPARPRSDTTKISMSYIETANVEDLKEVQPQILSNVIVEDGGSALAELE